MANNDRRLILLQNPASLQSRSAVIVAGQLWQAELSKKGFDARTLKTASPRLPNISLPKSIEAMINSCTKSMKKSMISWQDFHYLRIFYPHDRTNCISLYVNFLVWRSDCEICYKDTAKNLIEFPHLSLISKYKLACLYSFEDDVHRLWHLLPIDSALKSTTFETDPLLYYWSCRMKNEPVSIENRSGRSVDVEMIERAAGTWSSFLYFWNRLSSAEQIDLFVQFVKNTMEEETRFLLGFLSETQLETAIELSSDNIIVVLACLPENLDYTLQTWRYIRNTVSIDAFVDMICNIGLLESSLVHISGLLYDIWQETPNHLKTQALNSYSDTILEDLYATSSEAVVGLARDIRLITELLRHRDLEFRTDYWMDYWTWLISGVNSTRLGALMKLCFETDEKVAEFKSTYMTDYTKIKSYCDLLLGRGCFDELNEFLNFCSSDPRVVSKLKKNIIWSKTSIKYCVHYYGDEEKTRAYEEFVKDIQIEQEQAELEEGEDLKSQLISSFWVDGYLRGHMNGGNMQSIKNLVCMVINVGSIDTSDIKRNLLETCQCILTKGKFKTFDGHEWNEFLLWCLNNDTEKLSEFKASLPIDDIFKLLCDDWIAAVKYSLLNYPCVQSSFTMNPNRRYPFGIYDTETESDTETEDDRSSASSDEVGESDNDSDIDRSVLEGVANLFASDRSSSDDDESTSDSDQSEDESNDSDRSENDLESNEARLENNHESSVADRSENDPESNDPDANRSENDPESNDPESNNANRSENNPEPNPNRPRRYRFTSSDDTETELESNQESDDSSSDTSGSISESNFTDNVVESFDTMDNFLMWYFSDPQKINEFKIIKIQHHDNNYTIHEALISADEQLSKIVLEWFFNSDAEQIEIFKASLSN